MLKKLTRHGNSLALVIDKPILQLLNINESSELEIVTDGKCLMIIPPKKAAHTARVDALIKASMTRYAEVYRGLSGPELEKRNDQSTSQSTHLNKVDAPVRSAEVPKNKRKQLNKWLGTENKRYSKVHKELSK